MFQSFLTDYHFIMLVMVFHTLFKFQNGPEKHVPGHLAAITLLVADQFPPTILKQTQHINSQRDPCYLYKILVSEYLFWLHVLHLSFMEWEEQNEKYSTPSHSPLRSYMYRTVSIFKWLFSFFHSVRQWLIYNDMLSEFNEKQ